MVGGGESYHWVDGFIFGLLKVEVMTDNMIATFIHTVKNNLHIKFAPSLF